MAIYGNGCIVGEILKYARSSDMLGLARSGRSEPPNASEEHEEGQFDDAPVPGNNPRDGATFVDDQVLEWSESDSGDGEDKDELDEDGFEEDRVEDEDWEVAERGVCNSPLRDSAYQVF